jgi:predicted MFS family arabinose efflux permease
MAHARPRDAVKTTQWGVVAIAILAAVIAAGHVGKLPPALPSIRADLGLSIVGGGWLASLFSTTGMLTAIAFGAVAGRFNSWRTAIGGLLLMAASGLFGAFAETAAPLFLSRFLEGVGFLAVAVSAPSIIAVVTAERDRNIALGFFSAYMPGGVSIMILLAPAALYLGGWRTLWEVVALIAAAGALAMMAVARGTPRPPPAAPVPWSTIGKALAQSGPWLVATCFALYAAQFYAIITWMPTFMIEERGANPAAASALTALIVVANGASSIVGGWLLHRGVAPWMVVLGVGVIMGVSAFPVFSAGVPDVLRYIASVVMAGTGAAVAAVTFASPPLFASSPAQIGVLNGLMVQASNFAQFAGPTALAAGVSRSGRWESALWAMVSVNIVMIILALVMHHQGKAVPA